MFLKGFYHIWPWWPSWTIDWNHLNKLSFPQYQDAKYEIWFQLANWLQRRRCLKMFTEDVRMVDRQWMPDYTISLPWAFSSGELKRWQIINCQKSHERRQYFTWNVNVMFLFHVSSRIHFSQWKPLSFHLYFFFNLLLLLKRGWSYRMG